MINQLGHPSAISFTGNPIIARLASDNFLQSAGAVTLYLLRFTAEEANNRTFQLISARLQLQFTFKSSPNANSALELPLRGALSLANWMVAIATVMQANYQLIEDYEVSTMTLSGNTWVSLKARKPGAGYNLTYTAQTSANGATNSFQVGADRTIRPNFKLLLQAYRMGVFDFVRGGEDRLPVNDEGQATFEIEELLREDLMHELIWPESPVTRWSYRNRLCQKAFMRWAEVFGDPATPQRLFRSPDFCVLQGRLPKSRLNEFQRLYGDPLKFFNTTRRFMTWQPLVKEVFRYQPERLYYLVHQSSTTQVKLEVTAVRGNVATTSIVATLTAVQFQVIEFITSPAFLFSDIAAIDEIRIRILNQSNVAISATQTYLLKNAAGEVHYYLFRNSWGAFDSVAFTGDRLVKMPVKQDWIDTWQPAYYDERATTGYADRADESEIIEVNSGYTSDREYFRWLEEFAISRNRYEVEGDELRQIRLDDIEVFRSKTEQDLLAMELTYTRMPRTQVYFEVDPQTLIGVASSALIDASVPVNDVVGAATFFKGLNGLEEVYMPGNSYFNVNKTGIATDRFTVLALINPAQDDFSIVRDGGGVSEIFHQGTLKIRESAGALLDTGITLQMNLHQLLYVSVNNMTNVMVSVNGTKASFTGVLGAAMSFTQFSRNPDKKYLKGRFANLRYYTQVSEADDDARLLKAANDYGIAVPGAAWMQQYDPSTQADLVSKRYTQDEVRKGVIR